MTMIPDRSPDSIATGREPTAVFAACPDCGRSKSHRLTLLEAHGKYGYAKTACPTCCLTDLPRTPNDGR
jgi:hypothetical protein